MSGNCWFIIHYRTVLIAQLIFAVKHTIASTDYSSILQGLWCPCQGNTWVEVEVIGEDKRSTSLAKTWIIWPVGIIPCACVDVEGIGLVIDFGERAVEGVAQASVQSKVRAQLPLVLNVAINVSLTQPF